MEKRIKDFEDYSVDHDGNVYSYKSGNRHKMKLSLDSKGRYLQVGLSKDGKVYKKLVHRLVAEAFIPNPNNFPEVDHIDKDKTNNRVSNLR